MVGHNTGQLPANVQICCTVHLAQAVAWVSVSPANTIIQSSLRRPRSTFRQCFSRYDQQTMSLWFRGWLVSWSSFIISLELPKCTWRQAVKYCLLEAGTLSSPLDMSSWRADRRGEDHGAGSKSSKQEFKARPQSSLSTELWLLLPCTPLFKPWLCHPAMQCLNAGCHAGGGSSVVEYHTQRGSSDGTRGRTGQKCHSENLWPVRYKGWPAQMIEMDLPGVK